MPNEKNLVPISNRSSSEAREMGRKGGIASGKSRRFKKAIMEWLESEDAATGLTNLEAAVAGVGGRAKAGDPKALEVLRDTIGEKPVDEVAASGDITICWGGKDDDEH